MHVKSAKFKEDRLCTSEFIALDVTKKDALAVFDPNTREIGSSLENGYVIIANLHHHPLTHL